MVDAVRRTGGLSLATVQGAFHAARARSGGAAPSSMSNRAARPQPRSATPLRMSSSDGAVNAFPDIQLDRRPCAVVPSDDAWQQAIRDRVDRGHNDLPALLVGKLAHAANGNAQVVQHPLVGGGPERQVITWQHRRGYRVARKRSDPGHIAFSHRYANCTSKNTRFAPPARPQTDGAKGRGAGAILGAIGGNAGLA
jgi:hypothetical protein